MAPTRTRKNATQQTLTGETAEEALPEGFVKTATYPKPPKFNSKIAQLVDMVVNTATYDADGKVVEAGRTVSIYGLHGIGKSSSIDAEFKRRGIRTVVLSLPTIEISDLYLPMVRKEAAADGSVERVLATHLHRRFLGEGNWVLIGDDFRRVQPSVLSALMEITNEHTLAGVKIPGLVGVVLLDNPVGEGYQGVISGDIAFESRMPHFEVTTNDIPWRQALAHKYVETDLKPVFTRWEGLDPAARRILNPRVLDHVISVALEGLPPILGLPITPNGRTKIVNVAGDDITDEVLRSIANGLGVPYSNRTEGMFSSATRVALRKGWNVHIVGPHGVAKTATVKTVGRELGVQTHIWSAANMSMADLVLPAPHDGWLDFIPNPVVTDAASGPRIFVFDEMFRASREVKPTMLEIFGNRTVAGIPIVECAGVWAINNPAKFGALSFRVGATDDALCSRFELNLEVTDADTDWRGWLTSKYGEDVIRPFLQWRAEDLDDTGRQYVPPRTLEIMIQTHLSGLKLEEALPFLGSERLPVRLTSLHARLAKREVLGFARIVAEADQLIARLSDPATEERVILETQAAISTALQKAEVADLTANEAVCVRLVGVLNKNFKIALIRTKAPERQTFWARVFTKITQGSSAPA